MGFSLLEPGLLLIAASECLLVEHEHKKRWENVTLTCWFPLRAQNDEGRGWMSVWLRAHLPPWRTFPRGAAVGPPAASFLLPGQLSWGWQGALLVSPQSCFGRAVRSSHWYGAFENWHVAYFLFDWVIRTWFFQLPSYFICVQGKLAEVWSVAGSLRIREAAAVFPRPSQFCGAAQACYLPM